jgi:hypothetical protein
VFQNILRYPKGNEFLFDLVWSIAVGGSHPSPIVPLWSGLVGPSGAGKTMLLLMLGVLKDYVYIGDDMTDHALVSCKPDDNTGESPSLLERLDGKTYVIDDFSVIASAKEDTQALIASQLRGAFKGSIRKEHGLGQGFRYAEGRFNMIMGAVEEFDEYILKYGQLGQRFFVIRVHIPFDKEDAYSLHAEKIRSTKHIWSRQLRDAIQEQLLPFIKNQPTDPEKIAPALPPETMKTLIYLCGTVAKLRSLPKGLVQAPTKTRHPLLSRMIREIQTRLSDQLAVLTWNRAHLDNRDAWNESDLCFLRRIAWDTLPQISQRFVWLLHEDTEGKTARVIGQALNLPEGTVASIAYGWEEIGVFSRRSGDTMVPCWRFTEKFRNRINEVWAPETEWWPHICAPYQEK